MISGLGITVDKNIKVIFFKKILAAFKCRRLNVNISFSFQMVALPKKILFCFQNFDLEKKLIALYVNLYENHLTEGNIIIQKYTFMDFEA